MRQRGFYAYIRTSTIRQGTEGVSLEVQRSDAERLARLKGVEIVKLFCEMETAAKQGRRQFAQMMKELRAGAAEGLILHKIDRGARNLREWSDITDLIELGVKVYFVHDALDLTTRGGRLTGDMLAAVAADYIRNLREETKKGIVGRLKQGLWPFGAPVGYVNNGKGQAKTIDPIKGPLIRTAFKLYATGDYTLKALRKELHARGLKAPAGKNALGVILSNPFYVGKLVLRSSGEAFPGIHEPLVDQALFDEVQAALAGRFRRKPGKHFFLYRRAIRCDSCGQWLAGERQKGHIYYRCHTKACAGTSFREERAHEAVELGLRRLSLFMQTCPGLEPVLREAIAERSRTKDATMQMLLVKRGKLEERLSAAADAVIDGLLDRETFLSKKNELLDAKARIAGEIAQLETNGVPIPPLAEHYLELTKAFQQQAFRSSPAVAMEMAKRMKSNLHARQKSVELRCSDQFQEVLDQAKTLECALRQDDFRTSTEYWVKLLMDSDNVPTSPCPRDMKAKD
ncbi:recombinase family protein [Ramlibacter sp. RBP-2]|uniref:Recombinase family protein n=1 Tax=Ramlibacter lithotrophicus TaxID=2606681 RepID=A0A7X6I764_9BURK|nr:recombinase family protein [Ramlibacter lithotrophicus]NKE66864.1 recombinase family protein [Ramlibacter lithotrophicus]